MTIRALNLYYLLISFSVSEVAPYLRGSGARQQVVLEGNRLVLTCLVGGSWPLQYRWTLNNSNVTDWTPQYRLVPIHSWRISLHPSFPLSSRSLRSWSPSGRRSISTLLFAGFSCSTGLDTFGFHPEFVDKAATMSAMRGPWAKAWPIWESFLSVAIIWVVRVKWTEVWRGSSCRLPLTHVLRSQLLVNVLSVL